MATSRSYTENKRYLAELSVYGFIREHYPHEVGDEISWPEDLSSICLLMYFILCDEWDEDLSHPEMIIDCEQNTIDSPKRLVIGFFDALGTITVKKGDIKTWRIKTDSTIWLGVIDHETCLAIDHNDPNFIKQISVNDNELNAILCNKNDIISMILDMSGDKYGTLAFKVNDKDYQIAFNEIDLDKRYHIVAQLTVYSQVKLFE